MTATAAPALTDQPIEQVAVNTIRTLCMDAVQAANSGHPGTPMALGPVTYTLWQRFLRFDPAAPIWSNRDRFVLSAGHASTLLYAMLHLTGVKSVNPQYEVFGEPAVPLDDLRKFRQLDSKCPGHPEYRWTAGVECTTGPLGTGHRHRHQRRHGHRRPLARPPLSTGPGTTCSTTTCTHWPVTAV
jgi:transketolase